MPLIDLSAAAPPGALALAFGLTLLAGISTGLGGLLAVFTAKADGRFFAGALGFSAGVMIYVSFVEILANAQEELRSAHGETASIWLMVAGFFGGIAVIAVIDRLVPHDANPHEYPEGSVDLSAQHTQSLREGAAQAPPLDAGLLRMGLLTALAVTIHNFPEGFATFMTALADPQVAVAVAIAIALHNIPEGVAVAVPVHRATGSLSKAMWLSFASGLAEPLGAVLGYLLLRPFLTPTLFGMVFAAVAGVMVFISFDKLLPTAERYGGHHTCVYGVVAGMGVMGISLALLA